MNITEDAALDDICCVSEYDLLDDPSSLVRKLDCGEYKWPTYQEVGGGGGGTYDIFASICPLFRAESAQSLWIILLISFWWRMKEK